MKEITHDMLAQFRTAYEADGQAQVPSFGPGQDGHG